MSLKRQTPLPQGYCSSSQLPTDAVPASGQLKVAAVQLVFGSANRRGKGFAMLLRTVKE